VIGRTVVVFAKVGVLELVFVNDMVLFPLLEDDEAMCYIWGGAEETSKVKSGDRGSFRFRTEVGASVTQFNCCGITCA